MGKSRLHNAKVLLNYLTGLSAENKKKANDIIKLYKDEVITNYKSAENYILKLTSRGKGQENITEKLTKLKKTNIISSIVRRGVKDPKSSTYLYLNTQERVFKNMYNNKGHSTHQDLYPTILNETKTVL
jgi:hypothetical protein